MTGVMMSPTSDCTMPLKAAPMITPTARSMTLPRSANFLNSSSIYPPRQAARYGGYCGRIRPADGARTLIDQARMHHRLAHSGAGRVGHWHHRKPRGFLALAEQG